MKWPGFVLSRKVEKLWHLKCDKLDRDSGNLAPEIVPELVGNAFVIAGKGSGGVVSSISGNILENRKGESDLILVGKVIAVYLWDRDSMICL